MIQGDGNLSGNPWASNVHSKVSSGSSTFPSAPVTADQPISLTCEHVILPESIILHDEEMVGYCGGCAMRVVFPPDPQLVGGENVLKTIIGQLAAGETPDLEISTEIVEFIGRIEAKTKELRDLIGLISQMYEEQVDELP